MADKIISEAIAKRWEGVPVNARPAGWMLWTYLQVQRWKEARQKRAHKMRMWREEISRLSRNERVGNMAIPIGQTLEHPVNIEAIYGPLMGKPHATILVWEGEKHTTDPRTNQRTSVFDREDRTAQTPFRHIPHALNDGLPMVFTEVFTTRKPFGPKGFLISLFKVIGLFGGSARVTMKPSGITFDVDPDAFRKWVEKPEEMVHLLSGDLNLLQDHG
jgi:hypothetical protein